MLSCTRLERAAASPIKSQRLRNPFLLKIDPKSISIDNYTNGIELNVVCDCSFWLFSFWAVNIYSFHQKLATSWDILKNQLIDGKFVENSALFSNDPELYQDEYNKITHKITPPENLDRSTFGANQRDRYPLVVLLALNDREIEDQVEINDIVLLVSIIHLKDNVIPLETSTIAQYIKRKSGIVLNLQDLYVSTDGGDNMPYCVICQESYITRALLPCKHACVCSVCFQRIELCPLCRSTIQNFIPFNQNSPQNAPDESLSQPAEPSTQEDNSSNDNNNTSRGGFYSKLVNFFKFN